MATASIPSQLGPYQVLNELSHGEIMIVVQARHHQKAGETCLWRSTRSISALASAITSSSSV